APTDNGGLFYASTSLDFDWLAVADVGPAGLSHYNLKIGTAPGLADVLAPTNVGNVLTYNLVGVSGSSYYAAVQAVDFASNASAWSSYSDGITVDTEGPTAATGLITPADLAAAPDATYDNDMN